MTNVESDRTIRTKSISVHREPAGRSIGYAFPMADEAEFKRALISMEDQHRSANHFCSAWILGEAAARYRANDDGEPVSTAGKPILHELKVLRPTYCGMIVVRYFGGTLMGKPGLIHAYGVTVRSALKQASIEQRWIMEGYTITCGYDRYTSVKAEVLAQRGVIHATSFGEQCIVEINLPKTSSSGTVNKWELIGNRCQLH